MQPVERFRALLAGPWQLDDAALAIAAGVAPDLDPEPSLRELDRLADGVGSLDALRRRLFVDEGFTGNAERYYDSRNSLLPHVLARRLGLPITLALVAMEVGRRAGVALDGVAMPGHFLMRARDSGEYVDAFAGGAVLDLEGVRSRFLQATGGRMPFGEHLLITAEPQEILARMLENLRVVYRTSQRPGDLEWVLRMRMCLPGTGVEEVFELGAAMGAQARWLEGAAYLEAAAADWPHYAEQMGYAALAQRARLN